MRYHKSMKKIAIIGGGAAGMTCAVLLARKGHAVTVFERGERLGRKLSATGNGQGNVTNLHTGAEHYFSDDPDKVARVLARFGWADTVRFFEDMGGVFLPDARGRVYPAGKQASAVTDLLRREIERLQIAVCLNAHITSLAYGEDFLLKWSGGQMHADAVVLAAGGKAAKNFGTDGTAYSLARGFAHTVTPLAPALVQLRCNPKEVRGLKGIRVDAAIRLMRGKKQVYEVRGDVLFTESGVSGDAVFRASSYAAEGDVLFIDLTPDVPQDKLCSALGRGGTLCVLPNGLGRMLSAREKDPAALAALIKRFPLTVTGTLGFDYAQVTRGGIPLSETDGHLMSTKRAGLYFAGEILNVDGECGGYNLQWAFASAHTVSESIS